MPAAHTSSLREALKALAADPCSADAFAWAATELANRIEDKTQPDMATGALLRWNAPAAVVTDIRSALREEALNLVDARRRGRAEASATVEPTGEWLTVEAAAPRLKVRDTTLLERLRTWEGRRRLGWPQWDGHRWLLSSLAVDPATAAAYLATLPAREPLADLLPEWCERQPK